MRAAQFYGLSEGGREMVKAPLQVVQVETKYTYPDGSVQVFLSETSTDTVPAKPYEALTDGTFSDEEYFLANLMEYFMPDGSVLKEVVEHIVWSSGPCYCTVLVDAAGEKIAASLWSEAELADV